MVHVFSKKRKSNEMRISSSESSDFRGILDIICVLVTVDILLSLQSHKKIFGTITLYKD